MITIPSLNDVTDILDTDMVMVTQQSGQSYKIAGSELNKRGKIIIANSTTITGAPLKAGSSVRVYFTVDLTAANASTTLQLNYNNVNYYVKAPKDGTLINFVAINLGGSPAVFKYLQKYTTLELLFDGTQFVIIGNPVILSSADYTIYADGLRRVNKVENNNMGMVTSDAVYEELLGKFRYMPRGSEVEDCNDVLDGFFCSNQMEHAPNNTTAYVYLLTITYNGDLNYRVQFATIINNTDLYIRCKVAGTWQTSWSRI
jgi:hypothetical protein